MLQLGLVGIRLLKCKIYGSFINKVVQNTVEQFYNKAMKSLQIISGKCRHTDGTELESCWTSTEDEPDHLEDYVYGSTASGAACYLDEANGYEFTAGQTSDGYVGYGYVTTEGFSGVPIGLIK